MNCGDSGSHLVTGEGCKMNRLLGVILGEGLDSAFVVLASLLGQESQVAVTRRGEFTVRHLERVSSQPPSLLYTSLTANSDGGEIKIRLKRDISGKAANNRVR